MVPHPRDLVRGRGDHARAVGAEHSDRARWRPVCRHRVPPAAESASASGRTRSSSQATIEGDLHAPTLSSCRALYAPICTTNVLCFTGCTGPAVDDHLPALGWGLSRLRAPSLAPLTRGLVFSDDEYATEGPCSFHPSRGTRIGSCDRATSSGIGSRSTSMWHRAAWDRCSRPRHAQRRAGCPEGPAR